MKTRVLTGIVALLVVLPPILFGGYWGIALVAAVAAVIGVYESAGLVRPGNPRRDLLVGELILGMVLFWGVQLGPRLAPVGGAGDPQPASSGLLIAGLVVLGLFLLHLFTLRDIESVGTLFMGSLMCVFYAPLLLAFVPMLRDLKDGLSWIFFLMLVTWAGDTGAYLAGRAFGRHKLYPKVSPGKTIEGLFGGIALSIAAAFLAKAWFHPSLTVQDCLLLAPLADLFGVAGDLAESMLKRSAGVKDSGTIFPGHGGMLDRADSLMFSAPVVYAYLMWT